MIVKFGKAGEKQQFFLVAERIVLFEVSTFIKALVSLIAIYFVFDMQYPTACSNTLIFIQNLLLKLNTNYKLSKSVLGTITDMKNSI